MYVILGKKFDILENHKFVLVLNKASKILFGI